MGKNILKKKAGKKRASEKHEIKEQEITASVDVRKKEEPKETHGYIGVFAGSLSRLEKIDFSPWGLQCFHIDNPKLKEYVEKYSYKEWFYNNWNNIYERSRQDSNYSEERIFWDRENLNVFVPLSLDKLPTEEDFHDCRNALLLISHSEISILILHMLQVFDDKYFHTSGALHYDFHPLTFTENTYDNYLIVDDKDIPNINSFFPIYKARVDKLRYVSTALGFFVAAWRINDYDLSYVSLCIAMESIVPGKEQLTYRFRRNLAVLCGENEKHAEIIYINANRLYDYRSAIVHSGGKKMAIEQFEKYYTYARILSSWMIREMILHNLSIDELDKRLTILGFGDKAKISSGYKNIPIDYLDCRRISILPLDKI